MARQRRDRTGLAAWRAVPSPWAAIVVAGLEVWQLAADGRRARADAGTDGGLRPEGGPFDAGVSVRDAAPSPAAEPAGDAVEAEAAAAFDAEPCFVSLERAGVAFERVPAEQAPRVPGPLWLRGPLGGIVVESTRSTRAHDVLACPLVLALLSVSEVLRAEGVTRLVTYSAYRPGAVVARPRGRRRRRRRGGGESRHARALAIDIGGFERARGGSLSVLEHWGPHPRRRLRCTPVTTTAPRRGRRRTRGVTAQSAALHRIVCGVMDRRVFTVMLSPHFDRRHRNHLHWDVDPAVPWRSYY